MNAQLAVALMGLMLVTAYVAAESYVRRARAHDVARAARIRRGGWTPRDDVGAPREQGSLWPLRYPTGSGPCR